MESRVKFRFERLAVGARQSGIMRAKCRALYIRRPLGSGQVQYYWLPTHVLIDQ